MNNIEVVKTPYGRGVKTLVPYKEGDVITISHGIPFKQDEMPKYGQGSALWDYVFNGKDFNNYILILSEASLMNHSKEANVDYYALDNTRVKFVALRDIKAGEELFINYGYDLRSHSEDNNVNTESWNERTLQSFDALTPSQGGVELVMTRLRDSLQGAPAEILKSYNLLINYLNHE